MLVYPNAKINIGLFVTDKRADGFHNLETIFYPVSLSDVLEIHQVEGEKGVCYFKNTGIDIDCPAEKNLVIKAYQLLSADYVLPAVCAHLHKIIPFGAGLGGGSADAAFMLKALNDYFNLNIGNDRLVQYASRLGSDCAFFIQNRPAFASGKGDVLENIELSLQGHKMVLVKPTCSVATPEAYAGIQPQKATLDLRRIQEIPLSGWKYQITNDFEKTVFARYPQIAAIKQKLYDLGAVYASMTGSGSAVFALFDTLPEVETHFPDCFVWQEDGMTL